MQNTPGMVTFTPDEFRTKLAFIHNMINSSKNAQLQKSLFDGLHYTNIDIISICVENRQPIITIPFYSASAQKVEFIRYRPIHSLSYMKDVRFTEICNRLERERLIDIDDLIYLIHDDLDIMYKIRDDLETSYDARIMVENKLRTTTKIFTTMITKLSLDIVRDAHLDVVMNLLDYMDENDFNLLKLVRVIRTTDILDISALDTLRAAFAYNSLDTVPQELFISATRDGHPTLDLYNNNYKIKN